MFEKNLNMVCLLDFYGDIIGERRRSVLEEYYDNDLSLSEIAALTGISRQGVRDLIKKGEEELLFYEEKLGLYHRFCDAGAHIANLRAFAEHHSLPDEVMREIRALADCIR